MTDLTDGMLVLLAEMIDNTWDLRKLATIGLGVPDPTIGKNLHDKRDINESAYQVLLAWRKGVGDAKIAYSKLREALRSNDVGLAAFVQALT